jgi:hypothetical protein
VADSDSGVLSIFEFSLAGDPTTRSSPSRTTPPGAIIEETIDPGATTSDTVTVTATLDWGGEVFSWTVPATSMAVRFGRV